MKKIRSWWDKPNARRLGKKFYELDLNQYTTGVYMPRTSSLDLFSWSKPKHERKGSSDNFEIAGHATLDVYSRRKTRR